MGIRLITEVMDWAPQALTQREHKVLIVFAEDARDGCIGELDDNGREKRVLRQRPDSPRMLRRARVSRTQMYMIVSELIAKGCLERVTAGGGGHPARYRILALMARSCVPENRMQAPVDNAGSCVPVPGTQARSVSQFPGPSVSRFPKDADRRQKPHPSLNGAPAAADALFGAADAAQAAAARNAATPSHSLRDHDGPDNHGPDDQQQLHPATLQSPTADRNAREDSAWKVAETVGGQPSGPSDV